MKEIIIKSSEYLSLKALVKTDYIIGDLIQKIDIEFMKKGEDNFVKAINLYFSSFSNKSIEYALNISSFLLRRSLKDVVKNITVEQEKFVTEICFSFKLFLFKYYKNSNKLDLFWSKQDRLVCKCFSVMESQLFLEANKSSSFENFLNTTNAGKNCGSCVINRDKIYQRISKLI